MPYKCIHEGCITHPVYNLPTETKALYCFEHKKENMISMQNNKCQSSKCKETPLFGLPNKRVQYCLHHKQENMINLVLENKCSILECNEEYNHIIETTKYCNIHVPFLRRSTSARFHHLTPNRYWSHQGKTTHSGHNPYDP